MDHADLAELLSGIDAGQRRVDVASDLGRRNANRAESAAATGYFTTARDWHLRAAACFRAAHAVLPDSDIRKGVLSGHVTEQFRRASELFDPPAEHLVVPHGRSTIAGWLLCPPDTPAPPVTIVLGGLHDCCEDYYPASRYLLERHVAAFLVDLPARGEHRHIHGRNVDTAVVDALSAVVGQLLAHRRLRSAVGIWGTGLGGTVAAATAAADNRIAACCVTSGSIRPAEILDRDRQSAPEVFALAGMFDADRSRLDLQQLTLTRSLLGQLSCPLLALHGGSDRIMLPHNGRALFEGAAATDKHFCLWPDGDHGLHNHSHEKHVTIADWMADRLYRGV